MKTKSDYLFVPVKVDAWVYRDQKFGGSASPAIRRWQSNFTNLAIGATSETAPFQGELLAEPGIYVQWQLPNGLTQGKKSSEQTLTIINDQFPALPDRWLVARVTDETQVQAWVIESNYHGLDGTVNFPDAKQGGQILLGRKIQLERWQEHSTGSSQEPYLQKLSAVSTSDPSFIVYQPYNSNVFSFYEAMPTNNITSINYFVCGWYSQPFIENDPIYHFNDNRSTLDQETLANQFLKKIKERYDWTIADCQVGKLIPTQQRAIVGLHYTLCHGRTGLVNMNATPSIQPNKLDIRIAVGNTALDAFETLAQSLDNNELMKLFPLPSLPDENAFWTAIKQGLLNLSSDLDEHEFTKDATQQSGFGSLQGERHWEILPPSTPQAETAVDALNVLQLELAQSQKSLEFWQQELFALGLKNQYLKIDFHSGKSIFNYLKTSLNLPLDNNNPDFFNDIQKVKDFVTAVSQMQTTIEDLKTRIQKQIQALEDNKFKLRCSHQPHFWQPVEPVILVAGMPAAESALGVQNDLVCRYGEQLLTIAFYSDSDDTPKVISTNDPSLPKISKKTLSADLPAGLLAIWQECTLLNKILRNPHNLDTLNPFNPIQKLPPAAILQPWQQPWSPQFLEWQLNFVNIPYENWQFEEDYYELTSLKHLQGQIFQGRTVISQHANQSLHTKLLEKITKETATLADRFPILSEALQNLTQRNQLAPQINVWPLLSQRLSRLHQHLAAHDNRMRQGTYHHPNKDLVYGQGKWMPLPGIVPFKGEKFHMTFFQPIRTGQLMLNKISVVDRFGQAIDLINPGTKLFVALQLRPQKEEMSVFDPGLTVQLSPRINQTTRVTFDWLDAKTDAKVLLNNGANPICGWLLPNYLDQSILVYGPQGEWLGSLQSGVEDTPTWEQAPGSPDNRNKYPQLKQLLDELLSQSYAYGALFSILSQASDLRIPTESRYVQTLSAYIGRPLALARCQWQWELATPPQLDPSWIKMTDYLDALPPKPSNPDPNGFTTKYALPIHIGNAMRLQDGLVGYFLDNKNPYATCYSPFPDQSSKQSKYIAPVTGNEPKASLASQPIKTTLLIDPAFPIHAYTGLLPVLTTSLPDHFIKPALSKLSAAFKMGPLLTTPHVPIGKSLDPKNPDKNPPVNLPKPSLKGTWLWHESIFTKPDLETEQPPYQSAAWYPFKIKPADPSAHIVDAHELVDGWLTLQYPEPNSKFSDDGSDERLKPST